MQKVLGIDVGEKKIGLAVGDTDSGFAFARPALLVHSWTEAWEPLTKLITDEHITDIVVGWPLHANGQPSPQSEVVEKFIAELQQRTDVPILRRDERGTTQAVQREQREAGATLSRGEEDSKAAQLLVDSYLQEHWL